MTPIVVDVEVGDSINYPGRGLPPAIGLILSAPRRNETLPPFLTRWALDPVQARTLHQQLGEALTQLPPGE